MNYDRIHALHRDALIKKHRSFLENKALLEFGVYHGTSMLMWYDLYRQNGLERNFIGFDSFQGLPKETEDKNTIWKEKQFSTDGKVNPNLNKSGIRLVTGFYSDSLNESAARLLSEQKVGLVHVDCDTYSSTKIILEWLLKHNLLTRGTLVVYDDWGAHLEARCGEYEVGEGKAHKEIEFKYDINFIDLGKYIVDPKFYEVKVFEYQR